MHRSIRSAVIVLPVFLAALLCAGARGQTPASAPASAPATRPRYHVTVPPGFKRLSIEGRSVLLQDADEKWVTEAIESKRPTTRPTTMPSDLLERLTARRAALKAQMVKDLGVADPGEVDKLFDNRLAPLLKKLDELDPQIFYLIVSPATLRDIVKGGWEDPHFYYNRIADDVEFNPALTLSADEGGGDDNVLPALYDPTSSTDDRKARLQALISNTEGGVMNDVAMRAQRMVWLGFMQFIAEQTMETLKPRPDQKWFPLGVGSVLSARYTGELIGIPSEDIIAGLSTEDPRNPIRGATIDLTNPTDMSQLRQQYLPAYADAFNRKSVRAGHSLLGQAGDGAVLKIIAAWKQSPPADGAALVALIKQTTNVDLTSELAAH